MILCLAVAANTAFAQITACALAANKGVRIVYDDNKSCKGDLKALTAISIHTGVNGWKNVIDADKSPLSITGKAGVFTFEIAKPATYYGTTEVITEFNFVFNQFATVKDAGKMWEKEGKAKNPTDPTACADFMIVVKDLKACAGTINTADVLLDAKVSVSPNPAMDAAVVTIQDNGVFNVELATSTGQVLSTLKNVTGQATIQRNNLAAGLYYVVIRNAEGKFQAQKLIFE